MTGPGAEGMLAGVHGGARWKGLALAVALCAGCGFDSSTAGGGGGDGGVPGDGGGGTIDAGGGTADAAGDLDADVPVSVFCQGGAGLEACYELDGTLEDSSQNNNDLTGDNIAFDTGKVGQALVTTQSSRMDPIKSATLDFSGELTMEAWILPSQAQNRWVIDHQGQWGLMLDDDRVVCTVVTLDEGGGSSGKSVTSDSGSVPDDVWTHVACTYDGTALILYLDGVVADTPELVTGAIDTAPSEGFTIGRDSPTGSSWLGRIDSVRIWSVARKSEEIAPL